MTFLGMTPERAERLTTARGHTNLKQARVPDQDVRTITVDNPKRFFGHGAE